MIHIGCQWFNGSYLLESVSSLRIQSDGSIAFGKLEEPLDDFTTGLKSLRIEHEGTHNYLIEFDADMLENLDYLVRLNKYFNSLNRSIDRDIEIDIIKSYLRSNPAEKARRKIRQFPVLSSNLFDESFVDSVNTVVSIKNHIEHILEKEWPLTMAEIIEKIGPINMDLDYIMRDPRFGNHPFFKCKKCGKWIPCHVILKTITHPCEEYGGCDQINTIKYYLSKMEA